MKKILIPIDFSDNSLRAMEYGLKLAETFNSSVTLLNSYELNQKGGMISSMRGVLGEKAKERMREVLRIAQEITSKVILHPLVLEGRPAFEIVETAKLDAYDLIVMGTKGASGLEEIFIGSVANEVIKQSKIPVIVIPSEYEYCPVETVVFPMSDDLIKGSSVIEPLNEIIGKLKPSLEVYHFGRTHEKVEDLSDNLELIDASIDYSVTYSYGIGSDDVNERIQDFALSKRADLLCLIRQKRSFWGELFSSSVTTNQAFHSKIPLLVLHNES